MGVVSIKQLFQGLDLLIQDCLCLLIESGECGLDLLQLPLQAIFLKVNQLLNKIYD